MAEFIEREFTEYLAAMQTEGVFKSRHKRARVWNGARAGALVHMEWGDTGILLGWTGTACKWNLKAEGGAWYEGPIVYWGVDGSTMHPVHIGFNTNIVTGYTNP